jgi:hypothetical protein
MIEWRKVTPRYRGVACLAAEWNAILAQESLKSTVVGIHVATRARQYRPSILRNQFRSKTLCLLVTVIAGHCQVTSSQTIGNLAVPAETECGGHKLQQTVTILAMIKIWSRGKLIGVLIRVAIGAVAKLDRVNSCFALWNVASGTGYGGVLSFQGIGGFHVFFQAKCRWFESVDGVAIRAFTSPGSFGKLPAMRVGTMAIRASLKN